MASFSNTELNASVQELWDQKVEDARYAYASFMPRIANRSGIAAKKGDIINVTTDQKWTVGDVGSNGAFVPQVYTAGTVAITVNQHKQIALEIEDKTDSQTFWSPLSTAPTTFGKAFATHYDSVIGAEYSNLTLTQAGDPQNPVGFNTDAGLLALLRVAEANVPKSDLSFFLPEIAWYGGIGKEVQLTSAADSGADRNVLLTGDIPKNFHGTPIFLSMNLTVNPVGNWRGMLVHRSAIAIAFQRNNEIKRADRTAALVLSEVAVMQSLYGIKTIRGDHGVVINVARS